MRRALLALAFAVTLVPRESTPAGVPLVDEAGALYRWDLDTEQPNVTGGAVTFLPHAASLRDEVLGQKTALQAVRDGVRQWEIGTTRIRFTEDTTRPATGPNGTDRVNYVGWVSSGLDSLTLAVTTVTRDGTTLTDMDIALNDRFAWDTFAPGRAGIADIESLVAHEWGHAIGCDHVPLRTSTMYPRTQPGVIALRTISPDDRALAGTIYPNATFNSTTGSVTGAVDVAALANDRAVHVVAVSVVSGEPEASTLSRPDGTWRIDGLPAGTYRIVAAPCLPLAGSMNKFWTSGTTNFLPSVLRQGGTNPGAVQPITVVAGQIASSPPMTVADELSPFEPNNSSAQATPLAIGEAVSARFESGSDEDWYSFTGPAGDKVSVNVLSWGLGADADPALSIVNSAGTSVLLQDDARPPPVSFSQIEGQDLDVRVAGFALPQSGTFFLRLRDQISVANRNAFYVLMLTRSSDAPSTMLTSVTATPPRVDADGASTSRIVVRPRKETGDDVGTGATVSLSHTGLGAAGAVTDANDGTYLADVTAPATPGADRFTVTVTTPEGTATLLDAVTLVYLGPADAARTTFTVTPRRIDIAPAAADPNLILQASVSLVPRDAQGEPLGKGRAVVLGIIAPTGTSLVGPADLGDGSYGDTVRAGTERGDGVVTASVDGASLATQARIAIGFGLADVLDDVLADVQGYRATGGLSARSAKAFAKAQRMVEAAIAELGTGGAVAERRALASAEKLLERVAFGRRKAGLPLANPGTERDLVRAIREAAVRAIATAVPPADPRVEKARTKDVPAGDAAFAASDAAKAAAAWRRAYERVRPLQPR